jgi:FkbM family methyltransferase
MVKQISLGLLRLMSRSRFLSKRFLSLTGRFSKSFPDKRWKDYVRSGVHQVKWPGINFAPQRTSIGNMELQLIPHMGEFDFDSLIYRTMPHEPELYEFVKSIIKDFDMVLDIGANIGIFSVYAAKANTTARIYSFEPSGEAFARLNQNIRANKLENVTTYNVAVADKTGFLTFYEPEGHLTNGSLEVSFASHFDREPRKRMTIAVSGDLFEELMKEAKNVLVKIDTEGAEAYVLQGLKDVIVKHTPHLILEVLKDYEDQLNAVEFLKDKYEFYSITGSGLQQRPRFEAHESCRDYYLKPKRTID